MCLDLRSACARCQATPPRGNEDDDPPVSAGGDPQWTWFRKAAACEGAAAHPPDPLRSPGMKYGPGSRDWAVD